MEPHDAMSLLVLAAGAFVVPLLAGRLRLPSSVGEILFGVAVGPHALGLFAPSTISRFLTDFGLAFLMFLVGLEIDFSRFARESRATLAVSFAAVFVVIACGVGAAAAFGMPFFMSVAFYAMSIGIVLAALREVGLTKSRLGQTAILIGSIGEFLTIIVLTGFAMYFRHGFSAQLALALLRIGAVLCVAYLVLVALRVAVFWWPGLFGRLVATHDPSEIGMRAGMALMMVFVALSSLMGVESILGSFIAGALMAFVFRSKEGLEAKLSSFGFGFFIPIFFIGVGAAFDLPAVMRIDILPLVGLLLAGIAAGRLAAVTPLLFVGFGVRATAAIGLILSTPLTLLIVVSRLGREVGALDAATGSALVLAAIASGVVFPWLFRLVAPKDAD